MSNLSSELVWKSKKLVQLTDSLRNAELEPSSADSTLLREEMDVLSGTGTVDVM